MNPSGSGRGPARIAHLVRAFRPDDGSLRLLEPMRARPGGLEPHLIVVDDQVDTDLLASAGRDLAIHVIGRQPGGWSPVSTVRLAVLLARLRPDVVVCHEASLVRLLVRHPPRLLLHLHDTSASLAGCARRFDGLIASSAEVERHIRRFHPAARVAVVHDVCVTEPPVRREGPPGDVIRILQAGALEPGGGTDLLIRALAGVRSASPSRFFRLDVAGEGSQRTALEALARSLGLAHAIRFAGPQSREAVRADLCRHDLVVWPAPGAGPLTLVREAFLARVPALVAAVPPALELIEDGAGGWFFEPGRVQSCTAALLALAAAWRDGHVAPVVERAHRRAVERFSLSVVAERLASVYTGVGALEESPVAAVAGNGATACAFS